MAEKVTRVLFLCTGNSARSIMAECILNRLGAGRFAAHSAGSHPAGEVNAYALALLDELNHETGGLYSKGWEAFVRPGAPVMDMVITVCDNAAGELCPVWPGRPMTAHWPFRDPAIFRGPEPETRALFARVYDQIHDRIGALVRLPIDGLDPPALKRHVIDLGRDPPG